MKFVLSAVLLFVGLVAAQQQDALLKAIAENLEKRATTLSEQARKTLQTFHETGDQHLTQQLEENLILVEALAVDLKQQLATQKVQAQHHISAIEEELLHLENRVAEELQIVLDIKNKHIPQNQTQASLITKAELLIKDAKLTLTRAHLDVKESKPIQSEVAAIEALVKAIAAKPVAAELKKDEQQLARHEMTLYQLIEKVHQREKHNAPKTTPTSAPVHA